MHHLVAPLLLIAVGIGWLLHAQNVMPQVNWIWILLLATIGVLIPVVGGFNRATLVIGPFLVIWALTSFLRQTGRIELAIEGPILVIALGVLLAVVRVMRRPADPVPPTTR